MMLRLQVGLPTRHYHRKGRPTRPAFLSEDGELPELFGYRTCVPDEQERSQESSANKMGACGQHFAPQSEPGHGVHFKQGPTDRARAPNMGDLKGVHRWSNTRAGAQL